MKRFAYLILCMLVAGAAYAATPEQMDRARAIVYKNCLRYMNNGSGYLDEKSNPKSVAELEKYLKAKEKENLSKLKAIPVPSQSEYAAWDSGKFNEFWTVTYMDKTPKFNAKGECRRKAANAIKNITVTATEPTTAEQKPAEKKPEEKTAPAVSKDSTTTHAATQEAQPAPLSDNAPELETENITGEAADMAAENVETDKPAKKKDNSNTASIIVLIILVAVVVILVGYALNVMKKNKERQATGDSSHMEKRKRHAEEYREPDHSAYAPRRPETLTVESDPNEESAFAAYSGYEEPSPADPREQEIERLRAEIATLQSRLADRGGQRTGGYTPSAPQRRAPRIIYLAQANADGVFTRADAHYNMGNSIFKLVTTDGVSGSFSVIEDPTVFELALTMPADFLVNACSGRNLQATHGTRIIVNEASGTAMFEDGRWVVSRKARIRYAQ